MSKVYPQGFSMTQQGRVSFPSTVHGFVEHTSGNGFNLMLRHNRTVVVSHADGYRHVESFDHIDDARKTFDALRDQFNIR